MTPRWSLAFLTFALATPVSLADELLYRYEGDILPYDEAAGWTDLRFYGLYGGTVEQGRFLLRWPVAGDLTDRAGYQRGIGGLPDGASPPFWVEWQFRSNHPIGSGYYTCDANFVLQYVEVHELVWMYGDAAISFSGDHAAFGLDLDEFHTYRFESLDGITYRVSVDGLVFIAQTGSSPPGYDSLTFWGDGGCQLDQIPDMVDEWDFIRFGTISYGEQIIASDPPAGFLDARRHAGLDRFTVTFDSPNYVYLDEISVETTSGVTPVVTQTRRRENGGPDTVEIVLDRSLAFGETTRFTFDDGAAVNVVEYTFAPADTDGDGDADLADVAAFQNCLSREALSGVCAACDLVPNEVIDLRDVSVLVDKLAGPTLRCPRTARTSGGKGRDRIVAVVDSDPLPAVRDAATPYEVEKVTASDAAPADYFGQSVGISGNWVVVGAWQDDDAGSASGSAYVFRRDDNGTPNDLSDDVWIQQTKLIPSDAAPYQQFGYAVAISGDCIVIGAWKDNELAYGAGAAYVFRRDDQGTGEDLSDDLWLEESKLVADDAGLGDNFGAAVAIDDDYVIVGVPYACQGKGLGYIFRRDTQGWIQQTKSLCSPMFADFKGCAVSIREPYAALGAWGKDYFGSESGGATVFRRDDRGTPSDPTDDVWVGQTSLVSLNGVEGDNLGWSVAITTDWAVVGAPQLYPRGRSGMAYVFERDDRGTPGDPADDTWVEWGTLTASNPAPGDRFGHSVAIDGDYIIVGANLGDSTALADTGVAYVFHRERSNWVEVSRLNAPDSAFGDGFGRSLSIDGIQVLIGSWADDDAGLASGSAYLFSIDESREGTCGP